MEFKIVQAIGNADEEKAAGCMTIYLFTLSHADFPRPQFETRGCDSARILLARSHEFLHKQAHAHTPSTRLWGLDRA